MSRARGPWSGHRSRPPWWPENEPWPPRPGPGSEVWGRFGKRLARLFVAVVLVVGALPVVVGVLLASTIGGWASVVVAAISWVAIAVVLIGAAVVGVRFWRPVRSLIRTAGRLADGDYSARVGAMGASALHPVGSSLDRLAQRLDRAETERRQLLADLGHELRTPLTLIRGELEAMADGVRPVDPERLRTLLTDVAVMERLLDDLRTLSLAEAGVLALHREPTDVGQLVAATTARFRSAATDAGVELVVDVDQAPAEADLDPLRVGEVVANLVANALRATPSGGRVTVGVRGAPRRPGVQADGGSPDGQASGVVIEVADTGRGIEPEDLERVFDRFHSGLDGGTGLGLTITRNLVEAHGGRVELTSAVGSGTTAIVRLP